VSPYKLPSKGENLREFYKCLELKLASSPSTPCSSCAPTPSAFPKDLAIHPIRIPLHPRPATEKKGTQAKTNNISQFGGLNLVAKQKNPSKTKPCRIRVVESSRICKIGFITLPFVTFQRLSTLDRWM